MKIIELWLRPTTSAAAITVVALLTFVPVSSNDFWLHAAIGRLIWTSGEIPATALFPFTEASEFPFHAHEWLSAVVLYLLDRHLGYEGLVFAKGFLGLALFGLAYRLARRVSGSALLALAVSLGAMAVANYRHYLRPELFALLLTLALLNLLVAYREKPKWGYLAGCVPLAVLWANMHGSFPVALVIVAAFALGAVIEKRPPWPYALGAALMALGMLANPYGAELFRFAWTLQGASFVRAHIYEWMPTFSGPFVGSRGFWALLVYVVFAAVALVAGWRRVPAAAWLLLIAFAYLALHTQRHIVFFAFASIYPLSAALAGARTIDGAPLVRAGLLACLIAGVGLLVRYGNLYGGFPYFVESRNFSPLLVEYLEESHPRGNVLNSYALGAELVYRCYPDLRPAIDSRIDVYGEHYFRAVQALQQDERALRQFIERYGVNYMLLLWPEFDQGVRKMASLREDGWRVAFADHKAVFLRRVEPARR